MTTKDRPPQISRGTVKSTAESDLAICSLGDQDDVSIFTGKTADRCVGLTMEGQRSWNVVQSCNVAKSCFASAGDLLCQ